MGSVGDERQEAYAGAYTGDDGNWFGHGAEVGCGGEEAGGGVHALRAGGERRGDGR